MDKYSKMTPEEFHKEWNGRDWGLWRNYETLHYECELCGKQKCDYKNKIPTLRV